MHYSIVELHLCPAISSVIKAWIISVTWSELNAEHFWDSLRLTLHAKKIRFELHKCDISYGSHYCDYISNTLLLLKSLKSISGLGVGKWDDRHVIECAVNMMTSSNGNIYRVTGHLYGEFTGPRWIPHTKASDAELWCLPWSAPE